MPGSLPVWLARVSEGGIEHEHVAIPLKAGTHAANDSPVCQGRNGPLPLGHVLDIRGADGPDDELCVGRDRQVGRGLAKRGAVSLAYASDTSVSVEAGLTTSSSERLSVGCAPLPQGGLRTR